jgi:site-specific DNA-cytosine methylase
MKAISLFAGVGGFDLALTRNGAEVVASVEMECERLQGFPDRWTEGQAN